MRMPNLTQALRVRKVLYHLRGMPLIIPMTVPEFVAVFLGSIAAFALIAAHLVVSPLELLVIFGVVGVLLYALRQESIDGKTPGQWVITAFRWFSSPHHLVGERAQVETDLSIRVDAFVTRRNGEDLTSWTPDPCCLPHADAPTWLAVVAGDTDRPVAAVEEV